MFVFVLSLSSLRDACSIIVRFLNSTSQRIRSASIEASVRRGSRTANPTRGHGFSGGVGDGQKAHGEMAYDHEVDGGEGAPGDTESPEPAGLQAQEVNF